MDVGRGDYRGLRGVTQGCGEAVRIVKISFPVGWSLLQSRIASRLQGVNVLSKTPSWCLPMPILCRITL